MRSAVSIKRLSPGVRHALSVLDEATPEGVLRRFLRDLGVSKGTIKTMTNELLAKAEGEEESQRLKITEAGRAALDQS
jgi:hypothetical protein